MHPDTTRRDFLSAGTLATAGLLASVTPDTHSQDRTIQENEHKLRANHQHAHDDEYPRDHPGLGGPVGSDTDRGKLVAGRRGADETPVAIETPDLPKLAWEMKDGVKEFHLVAKHTRREFLPGMYFDVWGYNDSMPGPTIEAVEGDRVRIVVHNELPESTTVHWHGIEVPNRFDGVHGLNQDPIPPGGEFTYEFDLHQNGTFFYHSHGPMQEAMGMVGFFIIHPREPHDPPVDCDFGLILQEFAILPQSTIPNTMSMEFNFFAINGRSGPYTTPMVVRLGDRVRIRFMNLSVIDHHPMHLHGHTFWITGTEAGRIPPSAWIPSNNVLVGVAQSRDIEFIANNPGDWMIHCHILHHMMNHMASMVGPMAHRMNGMPSGTSMNSGMGMITRGPALSEEHGASLGRGMGEQTGSERAARNGPFRMASMTQWNQHEQHGGHGDNQSKGHQNQHDAHAAGMTKDSRYRVPGYPQDMMDMHGMYSEADLEKINKPEMRGMRKNWFAGVEAMMTVIRVLPPELYDKVVSGEREFEEGASVPASRALKMQHHQH